jgi:hypothetical protein
MMWTQPINFSEFYTKLRQEWLKSDPYSTRAFNLYFPVPIQPGKVAYLRPVTTFLILQNATVFRNVFDDSIRDELTGNAGLDLFFAGSLDAVLDRVSGETLDAITPV